MGILHLMSKLVSRLSSDVACVVDQSVTFVQTILYVNFRLVRWALDAAVSFVYGLWYVICSVCYAATCSVEDFVSFVSDLVAIALDALEVVHSGVLQTYRGVEVVYSILANTVWAVILFGDSTWRGAVWSVTQVGVCIKALVCLIGRALSLLGEAGIITLAAVPRSGWALVDAVISWILSLFHMVRTGCHMVIYESRYACLGFLLLCSMLMVVKYIYVHGLFRVLITRWMLAICRLRQLLQQMIERTITTYARRNREQHVTTNATPAVTASSSSESENNEGDSDTSPMNDPDAASASSHAKRVPAKNKNSVKEAKELAGLREQLERIRENTLCAVCQDSPRCITLLPCRHFCLCQACTSRILIRQPFCPICRSGIMEVLHVYS